MSKYRTILPTINSITPEYKAYLDRLTALGIAQPNEATKIKHNNAVRSLVENGLWSKIRSLKFFWNSNVDAIRVDVRNPSLFLGSFSGGYIFTANQGVLFNGTNGFFDTSFTSTTSGVFTLTSAGFFIHCLTNVGGIVYGGGLWVYSNNTSNNIRLHNVSNISPIVNMAGSGIKAVYRSNNTLDTYINTSRQTRTNNAEFLTNSPVTIARHASQYSAQNIGGMQFFSSALTESEHNLLVTINNTLIS
jgi:hypothetical protein